MTYQEAATYMNKYLPTIPEDIDKTLYKEACIATQVGAVRSAYIMVWLSCAESLKRRFAALGHVDDEAGRVMSEINRKEELKQSVDACILLKAREYGFISSTEHDQLLHIYEMRCVYGHPYELAPSPEKVVEASSTVTRLVLSRPLKLRHSYVQSRIDLMATNKTFLDDTEAAVRAYSNEVAAKVDNDLHVWLMQSLWQRAEAISGDPAQRLFSRRLEWFGVGYLASVAAQILAGWDVRKELTEYPHAAASCLSSAALFALIDGHAKDIVVGHLVSQCHVDPVCVARLQELNTSGLLSEQQSKRLAGALSEMTYHELAASGVHMLHYVDRLIKDLKYHDWRVSQNPAANAIRDAGRQSIEELPAEVQEELGRNVLQAAHGNARAALALLREVATSATPWPASFVRGLVYECFFDEQQAVRFKPEVANEAITSLTHLDPDIIASILGDTATTVAQGTIKHSEYPHPFATSSTTMQKALQDLIGDNKQLADGCEQILTAMMQLEIPEDERRPPPPH